MGSVMIKITTKPVSLMVGTVVDPMSIMITALSVNALVEGLGHYNPFLDC